MTYNFQTRINAALVQAKTHNLKDMKPINFKEDADICTSIGVTLLKKMEAIYQKHSQTTHDVDFASNVLFDGKNGGNWAINSGGVAGWESDLHRHKIARIMLTDVASIVKFLREDSSFAPLTAVMWRNAGIHSPYISIMHIIQAANALAVSAHLKKDQGLVSIVFDDELGSRLTISYCVPLTAKDNVAKKFVEDSNFPDICHADVDLSEVALPPAAREVKGNKEYLEAMTLAKFPLQKAELQDTIRKDTPKHAREMLGTLMTSEEGKAAVTYFKKHA